MAVLHGKQILEANKSYQNTVSANTEQQSISLMDQVASGCACGLKNIFSVEITFTLELQICIYESGVGFNRVEDGSEKLVL